MEFSEWVETIRKEEPELYGDLNIDKILCQAQACENQANKSRQLFFETWWNSIQK